MRCWRCDKQSGPRPDKGRKLVAMGHWASIGDPSKVDDGGVGRAVRVPRGGETLAGLGLMELGFSVVETEFAVPGRIGSEPRHPAPKIGGVHRF